MKRQLSVYLITIMIIVGCQNISRSEATLPSQTPISNNSQPTIEETATSEVRTPIQETEKSNYTAIPRPTTFSTIEPISTATQYLLQISEIDLKTDGNLWVYDNLQEKYLIINLDTGIVTHAKSYPNRCYISPISDSTEVICEGQHNLYLYDLATQNKQDLPITNPDRQYWPPWVQNKRFLVYGYWSDEEERLVNIYSFDIVTKQETLLAEHMPDSEYYVSSDGKHVIAEIDGDINDILSTPMADFTPVGFENLIYNPYSLIWSPVSNLLYIGAMDYAYNPFPQANYYFIANVDNGRIQRISVPTDIRQNAMLGSYWSPDGTRIAINDRPEMCILHVYELIGECKVIDLAPPGSSVSSIAWSPDSRYIAFFISDTVYIYDTETQRYFSILNNIFTTEIFWR